jgi:hypothetical protein
MNHEQFVEQLLAEFPELHGEVTDEDWAGLLHLEMACFARRTQSAIDGKDRQGVSRCFEFARRVFQQADSEVKNAVYVSYLENLDFHDGKRERSWAIELMPPSLKAGWVDINQYLADLSSGKSPRPPE